MQLPGLIAVHGVKRSGKGTTADYLVANYGYQVVKFADPLKAMLEALLRHCGYGEAAIARIIESDLKEVPLPALGGKSGRYAMQTIGTEWRDLFSPDMWSGIARRRIRRIRADGGRVALDDYRFPHETPALEAEGARLWLVTSSRLSVAAEAPQDLGLALGGGKDRFDLSEAVIRDMAAALLSFCDLGDAALERHLGHDLMDEPVASLAGRSVNYVLDTLRGEWRAMMEKPWAPTPAATAGHISERGLPPQGFHTHLRNDGTFEDLHGQIELALAA